MCFVHIRVVKSAVNRCAVIEYVMVMREFGHSPLSHLVIAVDVLITYNYAFPGICSISLPAIFDGEFPRIYTSRNVLDSSYLRSGTYRETLFMIVYVL